MQIKTLSPKERECLNWVAAGKTTSEIGKILGVSRHTITFHVKNACYKLNAPNRAAAIANAFKASILK